MDPSPKPMVVLDTNFLLVPYQFGIDIFSEIDRLVGRAYDKIVSDHVIRELKKLRETGESRKVRKAADLALDIARKCKTIHLEATEDVDEAILELATQNPVIICTNDKELKRKARKKKIPVIFLRQKTHLALEGYIEGFPKASNKK